MWAQYVPVGSPAPDFYDNGRPGTNLYTDSVVALDGQTGGLRWYKQFISHDTFDYDVTHVSRVQIRFVTAGITPAARDEATLGGNSG